MIKHIVMIKCKDEFSETQKKDHLFTLKEQLEELPSKIEEIKYFEVGLNVSASPSAFDLVLISEFATLNTLDIYRKHEAHQKVLQFIQEIKSDIRVVDYTF